ncbi:unnamed protein product [Phyllotreta striolata]|uniref:C-type lectin domain-containing protein n=1 Tax=Phyllotreta striolata TaxID=444603 RepID=A0A9N9TS37_PHYSR|nr:unnamed protein product [Phyllotreta striolata]
MKLLVLFALLSLSSSEDSSPVSSKAHSLKKIHDCPKNFIKQGHKCYYYSPQALSWSEAMFKCRDLRSNLAVIQRRNQNKLLRSFLSRNNTLEPAERWLGGVYDWKKSTWKWASSGKSLTFNGFPKETPAADPKDLQWNCIIMDPAKQYMWSSRNCYLQKHFICQTRLKNRKKLKRRYNENKLNEIPVPAAPANPAENLKLNVPISYRFEVNENLRDKAMFAYKSPEMTKHSRNVHRNRKRNPERFGNGTITRVNNRRVNGKRKTKKYGEPRKMSMKDIRWKTYKEKKKIGNSLYPQAIVEEYKFQ